MITKDENELCSIVSLKIFVRLQAGGMSPTLENVENRVNIKKRWFKTQ